MRTGRAALAASAALGLIAAATLAGPALAADQSVTIVGFAFSPGSVTVNVGDSVTFTNNDSVGHTATADGGGFDTGTIGGGANDVVTFDAAGTFAYHCAIHPDMTGSVVVEAAAPSTAPSTAPTQAPASQAPGGSPPPTDTVSGAAPADASSLPWVAAALAVLAGLVGGALVVSVRSRPAEAERDR
jgi:plastocyanin